MSCKTTKDKNDPVFEIRFKKTTKKTLKSCGTGLLLKQTKKRDRTGLFHAMCSFSTEMHFSKDKR